MLLLLFFYILFGYSRVKYFSNSTIVGNRPQLWATDFLLLIIKSYIVYGFLKMFCYISFPSLFNHQSNIFFFEPQVQTKAPPCIVFPIQSSVGEPNNISHINLLIIVNFLISRPYNIYIYIYIYSLIQATKCVSFRLASRLHYTIKTMTTK